MKQHPYAHYQEKDLAKWLAQRAGRDAVSEEDRTLAAALVAAGWSMWPPVIDQDDIRCAAHNMKALMDGRHMPAMSLERALTHALRELGLWIEGDTRDL